MAWRSLVARALWEHTFLQARLIAITDFYTFISNYIVMESDKNLLFPMNLIEHLKKLFKKVTNLM